MRHFRPRQLAPLILITAAAVSTGCATTSSRGALLGAAIGAGVGLVIASEAHHHRKTRVAYDDHHRPAGRHAERYRPACD